MKDLKNVILSSLEVLKLKRNRFFRLLIVPILIYICLTYICDWASDSFFNTGSYREMVQGYSFLSSVDSIYLIMLLPIVAFLLIKVAPIALASIYIAIVIHREILIKYIPREQAGKCKYYFRFTWKVFLISLIGLVFIVPAYAVIFPLSEKLLSAGLSRYVIVLMMSILAAFFVSFLSLVLPATAIGKRMSFLESIKLVLKNKVLMFGISIVPFLIVKLFLYLIYLFPLHSYVVFSVQWFFHIGLLIVEITCLSLAYHLITARKRKANNLSDEVRS